MLAFGINPVKLFKTNKFDKIQVRIYHAFDMNDRSLLMAPVVPDPRARILKVAGRLFSQKGYHGTSMRDLASALGLTQGSLYNHLTGKEELLFAVIDRVADEFVAAIERIVEGEDSARNKLRAAVRAHLQIAAENLETATVFLHEWKFLSAEYRPRVQKKRDRYEVCLRTIVAEGVDRQEFRAVDVRFATLHILSGLNWFYQWYSPRGSLTAEEISDRYLDLFLHGLVIK